MPNRIIKETILTSPNFNLLSIQAERHFFRILLVVDDYGCFEATPAVLRGRCYSLKYRIPLRSVIKWNKELEEKGILKHWKEGGRLYAIFVNFDKHNSKYCVDDQGKPTRHRRKTPEPPPNIFTQTSPALASFSQAGVKLLNPNPNPNPKHKPKYMSFCEFWNTLENLPNIMIIETSATFKQGYDKFIKLLEEEKRTLDEIKQACIHLDKFIAIPMPPRTWPPNPPHMTAFFRPDYILKFYDRIPYVKGYQEPITAEDIKKYGSVTKAMAAKRIR